VALTLTDDELLALKPPSAFGVEGDGDDGGPNLLSSSELPQPARVDAPLFPTISRAERERRRQAQIQSFQAQQNPVIGAITSTEVGRSFVRGAANLDKTLLKAGELAATLTGLDSFKKYLHDQGQKFDDIAKAIPDEKVENFGEAVESPSNFLNYVATRTAQQVPNMLSMIGPGGAARVGATALGWGPRLANLLTVGTVSASGAAQNVGETYGGIQEETGQDAPWTALAFGGAKAALDTLSGFKIFGSVLDAAEAPMKKLVWGQVVKRAFREVPKAAGWEGSTEAIQEILDIAANKFTDKTYDATFSKNWPRVLEAGVMAAVSSPFFSSATRAASDISSAKQYEARQEAPAKFIGYQETADGKALPLFNLTQDVDKFTKDSTLTGNTLESLGFKLPAIPTQEQYNATQQRNVEQSTERQRGGTDTQLQGQGAEERGSVGRRGILRNPAAEQKETAPTSAAMRDKKTGEVWYGQPTHGLVLDTIPNAGSRDLESGFATKAGKFLTPEETVGVVGERQARNIEEMSASERERWSAGALTEQSGTIDSLIAKLESWKVKKDDKPGTYSFPHPEIFKSIATDTWNSALQIGIDLLLKGRGISTAIANVIAHLRGNVEDFDKIDETKLREWLGTDLEKLGKTEQAKTTGYEPKWTTGVNQLADAARSKDFSAKEWVAQRGDKQAAFDAAHFALKQKISDSIRRKYLAVQREARRTGNNILAEGESVQASISGERTPVEPPASQAAPKVRELIELMPVGTVIEFTEPGTIRHRIVGTVVGDKLNPSTGQRELEVKTKFGRTEYASGADDITLAPKPQAETPPPATAALPTTAEAQPAAVPPAAPPPPPAEPEPVVEAAKPGVETKVLNSVFTVASKEGITPERTAQNISNADEALRAAGFKDIRLETYTKPKEEGGQQQSIYFLPRTGFDMTAEGNRLADAFEQQLKQQGTATERPVGMLLNTIRENFKNPNSALVDMATPTRYRLFRLAQSEASRRGTQLGELNQFSASLSEIAMNLDIHLRSIWHDNLGGEVISETLQKIVTAFREFFTAKEIETALNPLHLQETVQRLLQANERDQGGRLYRKIQQALKPKIKPTLEKLGRTADVEEAFNKILAELGNPTLKPSDKMTPLEKVLRMVTPGADARLTDMIARAVEEAELNAGRKVALADPQVSEDDKAMIGRGDVEPSLEQIERGLLLPEFAHWKRIRDDIALGYSPITLKLTQRLLAADFQGLQFGKPVAKPAETRINLRELAKSPDSEVQRVFDAYSADLAANMNLKNATPETIERVNRLVRDQIGEQLANRRQDIRDAVFAERAASVTDPDKLRSLREKINAGLLDDPRLSDPELLQRAAENSSIRKLLPSMTELMNTILESPRYNLNEIKQDISDALVKRLGLTGDQADELANLIYKSLEGTKESPGPLLRARTKALDKVKAELGPQQKREIKKGKTLWQAIERGVRAGYFDAESALEENARANKWTVPTPEQKAQLKAWAEEEIRLRTPSPRQLADAGGDVAKATSAAEAATQTQRLELIKKIQANWSRWSMPIKWSQWLTNPTVAKNNAKAADEVAAANLLFKFGFLVRQFMDAGIVSIPLNRANRALAHVLERAAADGGFSRQTLADLHASLTEMSKASVESFKETWRAMKATLHGAADQKTLDRMKQSIGIFDRMLAKADELEAKGNMAAARAIRTATILRAGYRVAATLDVAQAVGAEWQEMRQQLVTELRAQGKNAAQIKMVEDEIFGNIRVAMTQAIEEARLSAEERGLPTDKKELEKNAWAILLNTTYDQMQKATGSATDFRAENQMLRELYGWNLPETGGVGGIIASTIGGIRKAAQERGVPLGGLFSFGNAMGTATNRMLTFMGGGLFGGWGFGDSPWYQGERNIRQRRIEAIEGLAAIGVLTALAAAGKLIVHTQYPKDKEEKEKFIAGGHKLNTVEFLSDDGKQWAAYPIQMSPFSFVASPLYMIGGIQRLYSNQAREQARLDAEAKRKGTIAGKVKPVGLGDMLGVIAQGIYGAFTGGRTATGAIQSFSDYGDFKLNKAVASLAAPYLPGIPAWQEVSRMLGTSMDTRTATVLELLTPNPWSPHQRVNSLGDPLVNPNAATRVLQVLTGGVGFGSEDDLKANHAYQQIFMANYSTPEVGRNKGYDFNGTIRPMKPEELEKYVVARGQAFKAALQNVDVSGLPEAEARKVVQQAYRNASNTALASVGATPVASGTSFPSLSLGPSQRISLGSGVAAGGIRVLSRGRSLLGRSRRIRPRSSLRRGSRLATIRRRRRRRIFA